MNGLTNCQQQDDEANAFAFELLMPAHFIEADLKRIGHLDLEDEMAIERMAARYKVSIAAMTLRLGQFVACQALSQKEG